MKTIFKRIFLGVIVTSFCAQNSTALSYDFNRLSLSNMATSLWNTVSEHPKTVLGLIGATLGIAAVYKYFSYKNVTKHEVQPQIKLEPVVPDVNLNVQVQVDEQSEFEQMSDIDEMHQKYNQLLAPFDGNGKVILENLNARLRSFKDQGRSLDTVLQEQNKDFSGVLWRNHPKFNDGNLVDIYSGYWFFFLGEGENNEASLKKDPIDPEKLAQNYKIHLMPQGWDVNNIILALIHELETNKLFRQSVQTFKVKARIDSLKNHKDEIMPLIVIYPASGKHNAQYVLDVVRCLFKDYKGTGITPRYNQKVNDLIYFAQGDGDCKGEDYESWYENDKCIYYRSDLTPSGANNGYHLNFEKSLSECKNLN